MKKVTVNQNHTHEGAEYPAGSVVELPDWAADQLLAMEGERRATEIKAIQKRKEIMEAPAE
ncbi:hypothetical protein [Halothiobacillus sp.]|uniref:DUF7210 family protein n=1 Tax=Halothiobacillus sp. TaxID=1891311 RepID=UPI002609AC84|nr:hypothetical protein [Halothiobacillus sp.]